MPHPLFNVLFGQWSPPEATGQGKTHLCLNDRAGRERYESEGYVQVELDVLRMLRQHQGRWFTTAEIKMKLKTNFSAGGLGVVLREMVKNDFLTTKPGPRPRVPLYRFNGASNDSDNRD